MKRTLLVLAILALGGGCGSSCDTPGTITYYWRFVGSSGRVVGTYDVDPATTPVANSSCYVDGIPFVDNVRITFDDGSFEEVPCAGPNQVPGARLPGFVRGSYHATIDGLRGSGNNAVVLFTASATTSARTCGDVQQPVDLQAVSPADLVVAYDVNGSPPQACTVGGIPVADVVFQVRNAQNQIVDSSCTGNFDANGVCSHEGGTVACNAQSSFTSITPLPLGTYAMAYLELYSASGPTPLAALCGGQPGAQFTHDGFPVVLNLTAPAAVCPAPGPWTP